MLAANVPGRIALPFANAAGVGYKNTIPVASQIGTTPGAASYTDGFPPLCFLPLTAGGIAPAGADFNGLLNAITAVQQWQSAGGLFHYDSAFSTAIGGYPAGAMIISTSNTTTWLNLMDNNTTNPDATDGSAANWAPVDAYGIAAVTGLTNASVTLLPAQWSKPVIVLTGTLIANINIIFPTTSQEWLVVNNTTGAFVVTCKTSAGTGAPVAQGGGQQTFWGDGTNLNPLAGNSAVPLVVGTATAPTHAINQGAGDARYAPITGVGAAVQGTSKNLQVSASGLSAAAPVTADEIIVESSTNAYQTLRSVAVTPSFANANGANGLDTGAVAASTWYSVWAIWNGTTTAGLLSLSATAPTMPAGYTHKARVSWVVTDGTANKFPLSFLQKGATARYVLTASGNLTSTRLMASGTPAANTAVAVAAYVPPTAKKICAMIQYTTGSVNGALAPNPNYINTNSPSNFNTTSTAVQIALDMLLESGNIYWGIAGGSGQLQCFGWEDNL